MQREHTSSESDTQRQNLDTTSTGTTPTTSAAQERKRPRDASSTSPLTKQPRMSDTQGDNDTSAVSNAAAVAMPETGAGTESTQEARSEQIVPYLGRQQDDCRVIRHHAFLHEDSQSGSKDRTPVTEVLTWGSGESGQTMQNDRMVCDYPCPILAEPIKNINTISVVLSGAHCLLLSETGEVYAAGDNQEGEISPESELACITTPRAVDTLSLQKIVQVTAGSNHTAALTADQQVISWGNNEMNQLGHSADQVFRVRPKIMRGIEKLFAVQVVCGDTHTVVLTANGDVFTCGSNAVGSTGHGEFKGNKDKLTHVDALKSVPISQVAAGAHHTIACSVSGLVYSWGRNRFGQLGLSTKRYPHALFEPKSVNLPEPIQQTSAGTAHSVFVTRSGKVYVCGRNGMQGTSGQLGLGWTGEKDSDEAALDSDQYGYESKDNTGDNGTVNESENRNKMPATDKQNQSKSPRKADFLKGLKGKLASKKRNASRQGVYSAKDLVATDKGVQEETEGIGEEDRLLKWNELEDLLLHENGFNSNHPFAAVDTPTLVRGLAGYSAREVSCGDRHTLVLTMDGNLFAFGINSEGQLGLGKSANSAWVYLKKAMSPWLEDSGGDNIHNYPQTPPRFVPFPTQIKDVSQYGIFSISAGGDTSAAVRVTRGSVLSHPPGTLPRGIMHFIDAYTLERIARHAASSQNFAPLKKLISDIFGHTTNLGASFLQNWIFEPELTSSKGSPSRESSNEAKQALDALVPYSREWLPRLILVNAPGYASTLGTHSSVRDSSSLRIRAGSDSKKTSEGTTPINFKAMLEASTPRAGGIHGSVPLDRPPSAYSTPTPGVSRPMDDARNEIPPPDLNDPSTARARMTEDSSHQQTHQGYNEMDSALCDAHISTEKMFDEYSRSKQCADEHEEKSSGSESSHRMGTSERLLHSSGIDVLGLEAAYKAMLQSYEPGVISTLVDSFRNVLSELEAQVKNLTELDSIRVFLPIMLCPLTDSPTDESAELIARLCAVLLALPKRSRDILLGWIRRDIPSDIFAARLVRPIQKHISYYLKLATEGQGGKNLAYAPEFALDLERQIKAGYQAKTAAQETQMQAELSMKNGIHVVKALELCIRVLRLLYTLNESVANTQRRHASLMELSDEDLDVIPGDINSVDIIASQIQASSIGIAEGTTVSDNGNIVSKEFPASTNSSLQTQARGLGRDTAGAKVWGKISYEEFHNADVSNIPDALIRRDYERWRLSGYKRTVENIALCSYPFLLNADAKRRVLQVEAKIAMSSEMRNAFARSLFIGAESPFLVVHIRRSNLLEDSLNHIASAPSPMLKKPLKIVFIGEEGVDAGGVQKEWFQLLVKDLFDVNYGMFTYNENTRLFWFNPASCDTLAEYRLIGVVLGLAIYNNVMLDIHLPQVTYRKLLDYEVGYIDVQELNQELFSGFQYLLDYQEDDVEDVFCVNFEASYDFFGTMQSVELMPNGKDTPVTSSNKHEYVRKYSDWLLNQSIKEQFEHFRKGFLSVLDGQTLNMFRPEELELLICGTPQLSFEDLEKITEYDGGYDKDSETVRAFWETLYELPTHLQRKFLTFATGCDRAPIGGLSKLNFKIQKHGSRETAEGRLPAASTCFNILLLPDYGDKNLLKDRLLKAITETEGFGLM